MFKKDKKDLIKVNRNGHSVLATFGDSRIMFAFTTRPKKGEITMLSGFVRCREDLTSFLYGAKNKITSNRYLALLVRRSADKSNIQANVLVKRNFEKSLETGVKVLNIMEEKHRWPLTKMYKMKSETYCFENEWKDKSFKIASHYALIVASKRWLKSPHLVSLLTLILRVPSSSKTVFGKPKDYETLMKMLKDKKRTDLSGDANYVYRTFEYWDIFMGKQNQLFSKDMKVFLGRSYKNGSYGEGVYKLCTYYSHHNKLQTKLHQLAKKAGIEK